MAVKPEAMTLRRLKALLDVTSVVRGEKDLASVLSTIVRTVAEALEFRTVVLNLYRPAFDDFCVTTVNGSPEVGYATVTAPNGSLPLLPEGIYSIRARVRDWAGNEGTTNTVAGVNLLRPRRRS